MVLVTVDYMYDSVIVLLMFVGFVFLSTFYYYMKLKCVTDMFATSSQTKISPVYSKAQTVKINSPYKEKSIAHCLDFLQLILSFGFIPSV